MSYFDFIFPEQAEAMHLRSLVAAVNAQTRSHIRRGKTSAQLESDMGTLALLLMALIGKLQQKGVLTQEELLASLKEVDLMDGAADGALDPTALRVKLGLAKPTIAPEPKATFPKLKPRSSRLPIVRKKP